MLRRLAQRTTVLSLLFAVFVLCCGFWLAQPTPPAPDESFDIVVETTPDGLKFTCNEGCAWKTATQDCDDISTCAAHIDFNGIEKAQPRGE